MLQPRRDATRLHEWRPAGALSIDTGLFLETRPNCNYTA